MVLEFILASSANNWQITPRGYLTQVPLLLSRAISNFVKRMIHLLVTKPGWGIAGHCQDLQEQNAAAPANAYGACWETKQNKSNRRVVDPNLLCAPGKRFRMGGWGGHKNKQTNKSYFPWL